MKKVLATFSIAVLLVGGGLALHKGFEEKAVINEADEVSREERIALYQEALQSGSAQAESWPDTPQALIEDFWAAASQRDYQRLVVLCPGARVEDFKPHYDKWAPNPAKAIGQPEPHPQADGVSLYPVKVPFPGYPNKTVKMAVNQLPDGRLVIDGQHTIWW